MAHITPVPSQIRSAKDAQIKAAHRYDHACHVAGARLRAVTQFRGRR